MTELWDLVTAKSWQFFDIVKSDPMWLTQSVSDWALDTDYARILTKDSTMRRGILQVVEANRKAFVDCNKATFNIEE